MITSESIKNITAALNGLPEFNIKKRSDNPFFKSKYADLTEILNEISGPLKSAGLVVVQSAPMEGETITVITRVIHTSGEWIQTMTSVPASKKGTLDPQTAGSAITYGRRYALNAFFNLAAEDDDANAASAKPAPVDPEAEKLKTLPDATKDRLRKLDYKVKAAYAFCNGLGWDIDAINKELDLLIGNMK